MQWLQQQQLALILAAVDSIGFPGDGIQSVRCVMLTTDDHRRCVLGTAPRVHGGE